MDGVVRQTGMAVTLRHFTRQHGADRAVDVAHRRDEGDALAFFQRRAGLGDQLVVERLFQTVVLGFRVIDSLAGGRFRLVEDGAEVQPARLPVRDRLRFVEQVDPADQLVIRADAQLRHQLARLFGHEEEVIDHVFRLAGELGAQHRILRGDADRAGVQMAFAHHDATFDDQRRRREADLVGAQHGGDDDVATGAHLAVGLHADTATQAVQHQRLLRFGEAEFPRRAGMLDRRQRRRARAAVMAGDDDVVGLGFGDAGRDRAYAHFRHQLDRNRGTRIGVFQVVDQLRKVFNRINIVVRRRRNQAHARHREAQRGDVFRHLVARQLAAFAGLGALRHLDLDLVGRIQIGRRHAETAGRDLLDARTQGVPFLQWNIDDDLLLADDGRHQLALLDLDAFQFHRVTRRVLAAFAGVGLAADAVHGDGQRRVRLGADRTQRHGAGGEALDDILGRFDFVERDGLGRIELELEQAAQGQVATALVVDDLRIFLVAGEVVAARRMLQFRDRIRRPQVVFAAHAEGVFAARVEVAGQQGIVAEGD